MTLELPVLRLGTAGFNAEQQDQVQAAVNGAATPIAVWEMVPFTQADAWWVNGARTLAMPDGTLRVGPGTPTARSIQLNTREIDRPLAFAKPLAGPGFEPAFAFDLNDRAQAAALLRRFTAWLQPVIAQFSLASALIDHYGALGGGTFHVLRGPTLLAVVDMRGDVGVLPTAEAVDLEDALWRRVSGPAAFPENFARLSMSQLMWNLAMRTRRDLLPAHYRTGLLYFRRPPRLPQQWLSDSHLLLLRELASGCGTLDELQGRTGLPQAHVARDLAALYLVGAITSNPKRAAQGATRRLEVPDSILSGPPSSVMLDSRHSPDAVRQRPVHDLTAPAALRVN
jgi:hypothetical protein